MCVCFKPDNPFSSYDWGERKGLAATGFEPASPWRDLNPQSLAPRASTLSIRSHGALPMSYAAVKFMQANLVHAILQVYKFIASKFANRRNQKMPCPDKSGYCRGESCQGQTFLNSPRISSFIFEIDFQLRWHDSRNWWEWYHKYSFLKHTEICNMCWTGALCYLTWLPFES